MVRYLLAFTFIFISWGCGAALPTILTGITTAAQILNLIDNTLKPQNQAAQQHCAQQISALPDGAELQSVVAACDGLVDAWYAVEAVAEQLQPEKNANRSEIDNAKLLAKAKERIAEFDESYSKYRRSVP
jgi:hypothetical protein